MSDVPSSISIAIVIDSLYGGGAEKAVLTTARTLNRMGHRAHVISLADTRHYDLEASDCVHQLECRSKTAFGVSMYGRQARHLEGLIRRLEQREGRPFSAVFVHLPVAYSVVSRCDFPNTFYVVHISIDGMLRQARSRGPLQYLAQRSKWRALDGKNVITVSRGIEREIAASTLIRPASLRTIHNPIDVGEIRRLAKEDVQGIPQRPFVIHVGRASRQKRLDILFEAFRHVDEPTALVMLTNHPERVGKMATSFGIADRVVVQPFQQNPYAWMARARLLVLSSDFEGFGMVLVEALACGTPVVSTRCPHGPDEILTGGLDRFLVPVRDSAALGDKIEEALRSSIDVSDLAVLRQVNPRHVAAQILALATPTDGSVGEHRFVEAG